MCSLNICLRPQGRLGNQMFNLMLGKQFSEVLFPGAALFGPDLDPWGIRLPAAPGTAAGREWLLTGHNVDIEKIRKKIADEQIDTILLRAWGCRMDLLYPLDRSRALFSPPETMSAVEGFGDDELVIHVRGGDILHGGHRDYFPLPLSYYERIIADCGLRPVFVGQIPDHHPYGVGLRQRFPDAGFAPSLGLIEDFERIRRSRNICVSISTFAWLAAWLSHADRIYLPVAGFLNPRQRRDIDLLPLTDGRYRFTRFANFRWTGSDADLDALLTGGISLEEF